MALFVILNIFVVLVALFIDLYRHQFRYIRFSTMLLAIALNSIFNQILLNKVTFISIFTMLMYCVWTILQYLLDRYYQPFHIHQQKFFSSILTMIVSISIVIIYQTGDQSYYMSLPYLAPAIFLIGAIVLSSGMVGLPYLQSFLKRLKINNSVLIGTISIILSFVIMTILTPFWYIILIVNLGFIIYLLWEKLFFQEDD